MKQWEYEERDAKDIEEAIKEANAMGQYGHRLVAMFTSHSGRYALVCETEILEPQPPASSDVPKPANVGGNWTGWGKDESKCPKCGSEDIEQLDASEDEMTAGKMHCKSCGFEGETFLY